MKQFNVAIVGATGLVGQELIKILEERNFPVDSIHLYAADHSAGKKLFVKHQETAVPSEQTKISLWLCLKSTLKT